MKKHWKKIIFILVLIIVIGFLGLYYVRNAGGRNIESENSTYIVTSTEIINEFNDNTLQATNKYQNKAIEISGSISEINDSIITIDETIFCKMNVLDASKRINDKIHIKGRLVGFDDLFGDIKLDECTILK